MLLDAWQRYLIPEAPNGPINVHFEPVVSDETALTNLNFEYYKTATMNVDDREAFEEKLRAVGGMMVEPYWIGSWYLESNHQRVLKIMEVHGVYRLLELKKT